MSHSTSVGHWRARAVLPAALLAFSVACSGDSAVAPQEEDSLPIDDQSLSSHDHNDGPNYNLNVLLRGPNKHRVRGLIKFRQPEDADVIVFLDTRVHHLARNTHYLLQRATDATIDGVCTGVNWLTIGLGAVPQDIVTDSHGRAHVELFRALGAASIGVTFDIHFRVLDAVTSEVVLTSRCHEFTVRQ